MDNERAHQRLIKPVKVTLLVAGLVALLGLATSMAITMVSLQAAVAGYLSGQSAWSQSQVSILYHLNRYASTGQGEDLLEAQRHLAVLEADRQARLAMEAGQPDAEVAAFLVLGGNHPGDVDRMIWLFNRFGQLGQLQHAFSVWRESDTYVLELAHISEELRERWASGTPEAGELQQLQARLHSTHQPLQEMTTRFRTVMSNTARWLTGVLTITSVVFFLVIALLATWLIWRLTHLLRGSQEKYRAIFEQAAVGIVHLDRKGCIADVNPAICDILKLKRTELLQLSCSELVHPDDWSLDEEQRSQMAQGRIERYTVEQRLSQAHGRVIWARLTYSRAGTNSKGGFYTLIIEDISESRRLSNELSFQATHDALTGLYNRRAFERRLTDSLKRARSEAATHALCFIDLDQFKVVNDTSGHFAGDRLLQQVVDLFRSSLRDCDMLARLGGDEFAMILENCNLQTAGKIAEKLRAALESFRFSWDGRQYDVSCSIGVVSISKADRDTESLMRAADIACYIAKENGRNRVYVSRDDDIQQREREGEMQWVARIREAINDNRLTLDAQLILPINDGHSELHYEVLVRLKNEAGETVPPAAFLPAAERFGAAHQIDRWVINHTLAQLARHPEHLAALNKCHINLSGVSLDQPDFFIYVADCFDKYPVPPHKICFEVTETAAVNNLVDAIALMNTLGELGCSFALDDFGTGLSSFSYLRRLPVNTLKIDGVFVRDIAKDKTDLAMVKAINEVGQTLGKTTIAEFVETQEALEILRKMGVSAVQGYGVHKPCAFTTLLTHTSTGDILNRADTTA
ncbi:putative bifunctional diguanylate cyclase/phosphodiesterase [Gilvimarinus algae]|uniref:EAL domain-containing protein n=1 Tax=Gilvimarinus algae TaxID=3058037 RepID=A0ABT8TBM5_9GAMM|nr:EAL domain-containing protein [Gilvimarinus sp. SDUM040014]MDO3381502.1 EAL domain-containing protein [Gilvimarinus sp. SDUM040014]